MFTTSKADSPGIKFGRRKLHGSALLLELQFFMRTECYGLRREIGKVEPGGNSWIHFARLIVLSYDYSPVQNWRSGGVIARGG